MDSKVEAKRRRSLNPMEVLAAWGKILTGSAPMISIEITRECPLKCPGCYAYNEEHLGGGKTLRDLNELRGQALVDGVLGLVRRHGALHVSLVGGEPLMRVPELDRILPALSAQGTFVLLVTSAVIPIPMRWMDLRRLRVTVSVDGLPEHHDIRRRPATYERILKNIDGRRINIHLTITRPMLQSNDYLDEYFRFWSARPEVEHIWASIYTPQRGESSPEIPTRAEREMLFAAMPHWRTRFPKVLMGPALAGAFTAPPANPAECIFSRMSVNYSADLTTRVEPCILGGDPDCERCGCAASIGLHALENVPVLGKLRAGHLVRGSMAIGSVVARGRRRLRPERWQEPKPSDLVQISAATSANSDQA